MTDVNNPLVHIFPKELLEYFDLKSSEIKHDKIKNTDYLEVVFEERNIIPEAYNAREYESKGTFERRVQDFPIRGRAVFLVVKRRRWRHKKTGEQITRDFSFMANDIRFTAELADFLKDRG